MADEEILCDDKSLKEPFHTLISAAILAPSGDNTQPWRYKVDYETGSLSVLLDESRDNSPMNAGQRMARIACGAAIENIVQNAKCNGWNTTIAERLEEDCLATVLIDGEIHIKGKIDPAIVDRYTNRFPYLSSPPQKAAVDELRRSFATCGDLEVEWITDRKLLTQWAAVIGAADALMFGDRKFLLAFLENVNIGASPSLSNQEGLPIGSLGLAWSEQHLLPWLAQISKWRFTGAMLRRSFRMKARHLVESSSGLCILRSRSGRLPRDVDVGRVMQRAWLAITRSGMVAQPMMSLPVLHSYLESLGLEKEGEFWKSVGELTVSSTSSACRDPLAILRFGIAPRARSVRTGRRDFAACTSFRSAKKRGMPRCNEASPLDLLASQDVTC